MAGLRRFRWRRLLTWAIIVAGVGYLLSLEPTHLMIMAFTPEPFRSLPIEWSRVYVSYDVYVTFESPPKHAVVLVPAPTLDGCEIPLVTRDLQRRKQALTLVCNERGLFYRMTQETVTLDRCITALVTVRIPERPKRWLFWDNPLEERFDLSHGVSPEGLSGHWFYLESDVPVELVTIRAYLDTAYTLYSDSTVESMQLRLRYPPQGWSLMEQEELGP